MALPNFDIDGISSSPFTIGALGSLVALRFAPGASWWERFTNVACGALTAGYCAPALTEWLQFKSTAMAYACAFAIGLLGMSLVAAVLEGIKATKLGESFNSWTTRR